MQCLVYKICPAADWHSAVAPGTYVGSPDDLRDGFIHLSTADQLAGTLARHFAAQPNLLLITLATASLGEPLTWEPSRGGQLFPHLYGPLATSLAVAVESLAVGADGVHILPAKLGKDLR